MYIRVRFCFGTEAICHSDKEIHKADHPIPSKSTTTTDKSIMLNVGIKFACVSNVNASINMTDKADIHSGILA
jgi:hypothetical protein